MAPRVCDTVGIVKGDVAATTAVPVDGRRSRWDAHRGTRREELIDAAVRSVKRHGPEAGMDQIAADAHTSKPVIYRYFADKTDLHRAVTQRVVGTILAALRAVTERAPGPQELITRQRRRLPRAARAEPRSCTGSWCATRTSRTARRSAR